MFEGVWVAKRACSEEDTSEASLVRSTVTANFYQLFQCTYLAYTYFVRGSTYHWL